MQGDSLEPKEQGRIHLEKRDYILIWNFSFINEAKDLKEE